MSITFFSHNCRSEVVLESTLSFTDVLTNVLMKENQTGQEVSICFGIRWMEEKGHCCIKNYSKVISSGTTNLMETTITDSKRFRKEGEIHYKTVFHRHYYTADPKLIIAQCRLDRFYWRIFENHQIIAVWKRKKIVTRTTVLMNSTRCLLWLEM